MTLRKIRDADVGSTSLAARFFGGPHRREINLVGGLGMDLGPEAIGARAGQLKHEGFQTFKIKIGQQDHQKDIERVRAVRQAVGDDAQIRVDGNASYSFVDARNVLNELSQFHITDAEQPLARGDLQSLAELRRDPPRFHAQRLEFRTREGAAEQAQRRPQPAHRDAHLMHRLDRVARLQRRQVAEEMHKPVAQDRGDRRVERHIRPERRIFSINRLWRLAREQRMGAFGLAHQPETQRKGVDEVESEREQG